MKKCPVCKKNKQSKSFHKDKSQADGMCGRCKLCEKTYRRNERLAYMKRHNKKRRESERDKLREQRKRVIELLGSVCKRCGYDDPRALQIDHVHGGGCQEKKTITKRYNLYVINEVQKGSSKYQLLCANCNWIKRYENNEVSGTTYNVSTDVKSTAGV